MSHRFDPVNANILVADDEESFRTLLTITLERAGYRVTAVRNGEEALATFQEGKFDLVILDIVMPRLDGIKTCAELGKISTVPVILLTALNRSQDVMAGFRVGADDYITKPFNSEELFYRIQAILKRSQTKADPREEIKEFSIGKYHFNYPLRILTYNLDEEDEEKNKLSPKEAQLLRMFAIYMNDILPRSEALNKIWGEDNYFTARSMDVFVTKLRKYLKNDENIEIVNIHGNGFQLLVKAEEEA